MCPFFLLVIFMGDKLTNPQQQYVSCHVWPWHLQGPDACEFDILSVFSLVSYWAWVYDISFFNSKSRPLLLLLGKVPVADPKRSLIHISEGLEEDIITISVMHVVKGVISSVVTPALHPFIYSARKIMLFGSFNTWQHVLLCQIRINMMFFFQFMKSCECSSCRNPPLDEDCIPKGEWMCSRCTVIAVSTISISSNVLQVWPEFYHLFCCRTRRRKGSPSLCWREERWWPRKRL